MTIKMAAMTRTRTDISNKFFIISPHGIRSIIMCFIRKVLAESFNTQVGTKIPFYLTPLLTPGG